MATLLVNLRHHKNLTPPISLGTPAAFTKLAEGVRGRHSVRKFSKVVTAAKPTSSAAHEVTHHRTVLVVTATKPTSSAVDDSAFVATERLREPPGPDANKWPPDAEWYFHEGEAAFRGRAFPIQGVSWRLLKKLAEKPNTPIGKSTLLDAIAADGNTGEEALRSHLSRTRGILRKVFQLPKELDPLPNLDRGANCAWKLDEKVFPSVAEIQRSLNGR